MKNNGKIPPKKRKIPLHRTIRFIAIGIITLILLTSLLLTILSYQTPILTTETTTVASYTQTSTYAYLVYLKNNTLYDTPFLLPMQGEYFKQLISNILASITYTYQSSLSGTINGNYSMYAEIKTDLWTKKFPLAEQTPFTTNNKTTTFTHQFSINYTFYDNILEQINSETEVNAPNPQLIIHTNVILSQTTPEGTIHSQSTPELPILLNQKTIKISENLTTEQTESLTHHTTVTHESVILQRNLALGVTLVVGFVLLVFFFITKNKTEEKTDNERIIRKIYKKNGEWIIKTTTPPPTALQHILRVPSFEDIIKISEDLNKPLFHYTVPNPPKDVFYILDTSTTYIYELANLNITLTK